MEIQLLEGANIVYASGDLTFSVEVEMRQIQTRDTLWVPFISNPSVNAAGASYEFEVTNTTTSEGNYLRVGARRIILADTPIYGG